LENGAIPPKLEGVWRAEERLNSEMISYFQQEKIEWVDTRLALEKGLEENRGVFKIDVDGHPTEEGYRRMVSAIVEYMKANSEKNEIK